MKGARKIISEKTEEVPVLPPQWSPIDEKLRKDDTNSRVLVQPKGRDRSGISVSEEPRPTLEGPGPTSEELIEDSEERRFLDGPPGPQEDTRGARRYTEEVPGPVMRPSGHLSRASKKSQKRQDASVPDLPAGELPVEPGPGNEASKHDRVRKVPAPPEVVQPPAAGKPQPEAPVKKGELGLVSNRPRRTTRTPRYLEDFELFEIDAGVNSDSSTPGCKLAHMLDNQSSRAPEGAKQTDNGSQSTDLPMYKKSYRDALIGVKTLRIKSEEIEPNVKGGCKKSRPVGRMNDPGELARAKKLWQPEEYRQLSQTWYPKRPSRPREAGCMKWSKKSWQVEKARYSRSRQLNESWQADRTAQAKKYSDTEARYDRREDSIVNRADSRGRVKKQAQTAVTERKAKIVKKEVNR